MQIFSQSYYIVRFNDCDPMGHLNNARYIDYMLNAREDHLRDSYNITLPEFARQGVAWVVTNHEIQYIRPVFYNDKVCIASQLIEATDTQIKVEILMYDDAMQQLKALMWTTFTHIHIKTGKREKHKAEFQQFITGLIARDIKAAAGMRSRLAELLGTLQ